ncbi:hypothetical protein PY091_12125 [Muricauda sp. 81s02]|uniref:Uncharacterized protein n=1 Tax=Flagellimonas okinawensis TaxID=3031324 RepID=A0ABT5XQ85_9FLAO|nr:hypothetical protein [[Muricauda] okinawensis]
MRKSKILFASILFITLTSFTTVTIFETKVYICKGKSSKRYHYNKRCRGLSNCSTKIYEVTLVEAKDLGRTLCGWED